jgi:hypothetical protein
VTGLHEPRFDEIWSRHGHRTGITPGLESLARELFEALSTKPLDLARLRSALERLLVFLAGPEGRTDANCKAIDSFLLLGDFDRPDLPDGLRDLLADMAGALHDTVSSPRIAANFASTPEQLLARLRATS